MRMMFHPGRSAVAPLIMVSAAVRLFMGMVFTPVKASNAVWMCPLAGLAICLPMLWCTQRAAALGNGSAWENLTHRIGRPATGAAALLLALYLSYDSAVVMRMLANTAGIVALGEMPDIFLTLPLVLLLACVLLLDSDSLGNSARIWLLALPLLLTIMLAAQLKSFEPAWLMPVFGGGAGAITDGAVHCAGWIAGIALLGWVSVPDRGKGRLVRIILMAAGAAAALLALLSMLCPTLVDTQFTRVERLHLVLSNGRVPLSLQLVLILLWYAGLLYLMCAETLASACYLRQAVPKLPGRVLAIVLALLVGMLALTDLTKDKAVIQVSRYSYIGIAGILLLLLAAGSFRKGGEKTCPADP